MKIGYFLASEQFGPGELIDQARRAGQAGFRSLAISDHFHPWTDVQGQSPFVWTVIGAISQAAPSLPVTTFVTCPIIRIHPVILAQASATAAVMLDGHFIFGVGTGENLNEHVTGAYWPPFDQRLAMLREALEVIRELWGGGNVNFHGSYYRVVNARIYTRPQQPPPVFVSGLGPKATRLAAEIGDGLVTFKPGAVKDFRDLGGAEKPVLGGLKACFATDERTAVEIAHRLWAVELLPGQLNRELSTPKMFEEAAKLIPPDQVAKEFPCGPNPQRHVEALHAQANAGFDEVVVQQIGPDLDGFFDLYAKQVLPEFA
jgi:G6PDH family F420-dependent oxidoreductase